MTRARALICFAAFLAVATISPRTLTDAPALIGTVFGIGCGILAALLVATVAVTGRRATASTPTAPTSPWWHEQADTSGMESAEPEAAA